MSEGDGDRCSKSILNLGHGVGVSHESEQIIQENMLQIVRGRTALIIAHRLSTIRRANRILTIENGRIVEDGTHQQLMSVNGRYSKLYRLQEGGANGAG